MTNLEAAGHAGIFTSHAYQERIVDLGEVRMNYAEFGVTRPTIYRHIARLTSA